VQEVSGESADNKLKVFISYSRRDLDFTDQLVAVLDWLRFRTIIDRKGIHGAEKWEERLGQLILESDIVVFVLSPASAASDVCAWEVEEAARRGKRIIPVLCRPLEDQQPHERLRDLNYIHFYSDKDVPGSGFGTGQVRLVEALSVDVEWLREHTRLEELAARWERDGRNSDLLVRGSELRACHAWRDRHPTNAPELTALQRAFLVASEDAEAARTSAERKRLNDIAAAQADRQAALDEREAAVQREADERKARAKTQRILVWGSTAAAILVVLSALGFAAVQYRNSTEQARLRSDSEEKAELARESKEVVDRLIDRIRIGRENVPGVAAMKGTCDEAVAVTSTLASTASEVDYRKYEQRFLELYFGPMNLIEIRQKTDRYDGDSSKIDSSPIESAMVAFDRALRNHPSGTITFPRSDLTSLSAGIKAECDAYLLKLR
jgi:hypothetical protein